VRRRSRATARKRVRRPDASTDAAEDEEGGTLTSTSTLVRRSRLALDRESALLLPPAVLAAVWLGLLLAGFGAIVEVIYANADISSAPVIGELFPGAPASATTVLGYHPWYSTLWFELATRWLPFHRQVWEVVPWIASVAGIGLVAWSTAKVAGRWAGTVVAGVLVCAGSRLLTIQFGSDLHGATVVNACVLNAFVVLLVLRGGRIGRPLVHAALCAAVVAVTAAGLASDLLLVPAGIVPFVVAGVTQLRWSPGPVGRRIAVVTSLVAAASVVAAEVAVAAMHREHVYTGAHAVNFVAWNDLVSGLLNFAQSLADLFNGDFGGAQVDARSSLEFACAVTLAAAFVVALRSGRTQVDRLRTRAAGMDGAREAHVSFWASALALVSIAYLLSSLAQPNLGRYLVVSGYAVIVLAAVALSTRAFTARLVGTVAACILVTGSVVALAAGDIQANPGHYPRHDLAHFLSTFAEGEGLEYGYAAYWVAAPLTWESRLAVQVFPVVPCGAPAGLCTYPWHEISTWYAPRANTRTFLVVDPRYGPPASDYNLGPPVETATYGEYRIEVYPFDIASKLGLAKAYGATGG